MFLTPREYALLHYLATHPNKVFSQKELLEAVWHYHFYNNSRTIVTHIKRIRQKLAVISNEATRMLVTVRGFGYMLVIPLRTDCIYKQCRETHIIESGMTRSNHIHY